MKIPQRTQGGRFPRKNEAAATTTTTTTTTETPARDPAAVLADAVREASPLPAGQTFEIMARVRGELAKAAGPYLSRLAGAGANEIPHLKAILRRIAWRVVFGGQGDPPPQS